MSYNASLGAASSPTDRDAARPLAHVFLVGFIVSFALAVVLQPMLYVMTILISAHIVFAAGVGFMAPVVWARAQDVHVQSVGLALFAASITIMSLSSTSRT